VTVYRDAQLMISGPESAYGTAATLDRWLPYTGSPSIDWVPNDAESDAISPGALPMDEGSYRPTESAAGSIDFEWKTKGFGRILKAALGACTSTLVSAGLYQQVATLAAGPFFDALTVQLVRKMWDGTDDPHTYLGCVVSSIEWKMDAQGVLTATVEIDGRTMSTVIAKASATVTYPGRFTFAGFSVQTGTFTAPTATALASAATALSAIKSWSLKIDNKIVADDYRGNGSGLKDQPPVLQRAVTGSMVADNTAAIAALRTTWKANNGIPFVWNFVNGTDQVQFAAPYCRLTSAPTPNMDGNAPTVTLPFEVRKLQSAAQGLWVVQRTSDSAL
jgi:hypothetical protein